MTIEEKAKAQADEFKQRLRENYSSEYLVLTIDALGMLFRKAFMRGANAQLMDLIVRNY